MAHGCERPTAKKRRAEKSFLAALDVRERVTKEPVIVAFVGLVGSGKSTVARALAQLIGGTVVEGDAIRIALRKQKEKYDRARVIAEDVALDVAKRGGNPILDSDFVDDKKRASLREKARKAGVRLVFIRTVCDPHVAIGRAIVAPYTDSEEDFFGGASSKWEGNPQSKGAVVKIRELWRRTPQHYRWVNEAGGKWVLKKFPFAILATIDTTDSEAWERAVERCAEKLA